MLIRTCGFCGAELDDGEACITCDETPAPSGVREARSHLLDVAVTAAELGGVTADTLAQASAALRERAS